MSMAMTMSGEQQLAAPRETVWAKLNDPEVLKACIPGCQSLDVIGENEFQAVATNRVGPVKATFKGKVRLTDKDGGTLLSYNVEAQIGGKLAQLGQRLVNGAAKKLADDFFTKFAAAVK
jgi:carbon monoxide dehydrogenase subunit G